MPQYSLKDQLSVTSIGEESVLLDVSSGQYFGLNELGTKIIEGLMQSLSLDDILLGIVQEFDVDMDQARVDAENLLSELETAGLVFAVPSVESE
ncbi:MAG: PqqD family peptide modification chaperone [Arenicella sp.]|mgnify:CR=1 FL=1|nr:PqqD family peptide modification chaperone [Arenicella sp.]HAU68838.1 PqqD family protein [Gammaproteobacteria bacterium]